MQAIQRPSAYYQGPDRRGGEGMQADDCREQARLCFAEVVASMDPVERERLCQRGEHWMTRWRNWAPRGFTPKNAGAER